MRLFTFAFIASVQACACRRASWQRDRFKTTLLAEAEAAAPAEAAKTRGASVAASAVGLVRPIVGAGVLALPAGVAAFSDAGPALWPATALSALGAASAYSFGVLGRVAGAYDAGRTRTPGRSVGEKSAWS